MKTVLSLKSYTNEELVFLYRKERSDLILKELFSRFRTSFIHEAHNLKVYKIEDIEELINDGNYIIYKKIDEYDPKFKFSTIVLHCYKNRVINHVRYITKKKRSAHMNGYSVVSLEDYNSPTKYNAISFDENIIPLFMDWLKNYYADKAQYFQVMSLYLTNKPVRDGNYKHESFSHLADQCGMTENEYRRKLNHAKWEIKKEVKDGAFSAYYN